MAQPNPDVVFLDTPTGIVTIQSNNWTATWAWVETDDGIVQQITGWFGGTGEPPLSGMYVGPLGFVSDIALATKFVPPSGGLGSITDDLDYPTPGETGLDAYAGKLLNDRLLGAESTITVFGTSKVSVETGKSLILDTKIAKLDGIADNATANATDAFLLNLGNATGVLNPSLITQDSTHRFITDADIASFGDDKQDVSEKDQPGGYAGVGLDGFIDPALIAGTGSDELVEVDTVAALPVTGEAGKLYIITTGVDANKQFRWAGTVYAEINPSPGSTDAVPEGSSNKYFTDARVRATVMTGYTPVDGTISASDTPLTVANKLGYLLTVSNFNTKVFDAVLTAYVATNGSITSADTVQSFANKVGYFMANIAPTIRSTTLTGLSVPGSPTAVVAGDSVMGALAKLQSYINAFIAAKDASGGTAGLTGFNINFKNAAGTFTSFFTNANTASRTYTFQNKASGTGANTIADLADVALKANLDSPNFTGTPTKSADLSLSVTGNELATAKFVLAKVGSGGGGSFDIAANYSPTGEWTFENLVTYQQTLVASEAQVDTLMVNNIQQAITKATTVLTFSVSGDYIFSGSTARIWTLPAATLNSGKIYYVRNNSATAGINLTIATTGAALEIRNTGTAAVNSLVLAPGTGVMLRNDGTHYNVF